MEAILSALRGSNTTNPNNLNKIKDIVSALGDLEKSNDPSTHGERQSVYSEIERLGFAANFRLRILPSIKPKDPAGLKLRVDATTDKKTAPNDPTVLIAKVDTTVNKQTTPKYFGIPLCRVTKADFLVIRPHGEFTVNLFLNMKAEDTLVVYLTEKEAKHWHFMYGTEYKRVQAATAESNQAIENNMEKFRKAVRRIIRRGLWTARAEDPDWDDATSEDEELAGDPASYDSTDDEGDENEWVMVDGVLKHSEDL
ncbi:uncharacterized protein RAG0_04127 [Rhynchosporium agropyri]|uniref:Uncharacterized protein n=1 Tax=Rhynchosporium agropyri TaxID=914238 RepID=A0A1E1KBM9_9HELO|nr:uncharacterized protein RAG0_04127 [Rhynchosporium agropyri]